MRQTGLVWVGRARPALRQASLGAPDPLDVIMTEAYLGDQKSISNIIINVFLRFCKKPSPQRQIALDSARRGIGGKLGGYE